MVKSIKDTLKKIDFERVDAIIDLGDSIDRLLSTMSEEYKDFLDMHMFIAGICNRHKIPYIYLVGTPLHEMSQFNNMEFVIRNAYPNLALYVFKTIDITYVKELDIDILHLPDEVIKDNVEYEIKIKELVKDKAVDLILTHTIYDHQLSFPLPNLRSSDFILSMTAGYILNGHVHTHGTNSRLITIGSSDRISHNEEEAKGIGILHYHHSIELSYYEFIENKNSLKFISIKRPYTIDVLKNKLRRISLKYDMVHVSLPEKYDYRQSMISSLSKEFKNITFKIKEEKAKRRVSKGRTKSKIPFEITPNNIGSLLKELTVNVDIDHIVDGYNKHILL